MKVIHKTRCSIYWDEPCMPVAKSLATTSSAGNREIRRRAVTAIEFSAVLKK
jgi:hypothetical protein